jgi:two-component system, NarL family, nitrate/nitrite response regulator NarL
MGQLDSGVHVRGDRAVRRVLIVDDQRTFTDLLELALSIHDDLECIGVAHSPDEALASVVRDAPDVVIMDVHFPGQSRDGIDATREIKGLCPGTEVVLLTGNPDRAVLRRAAAAGAGSLMPKDGSLPDLLRAIRSVGSGGLAVHPTLLQTLMRETAKLPAQRPRLSGREVDVLGMLAIGLDTKAISNHLGISLNTCRGYVKSLLSKLHAHSQLEAVAVARRHGLLDAEPLSRA